jgi:hypothetical protein
MPVGARSCGGHPSRPEGTVDRPEVITKQELQHPPAEQSASILWLPSTSCDAWLSGGQTILYRSVPAHYVS